MEPRAAQQDEALLTPAQVRLVKIAVAAAVVIGLGVLAFFIFRALRRDEVSSRWDEFAAIQAEYEPTDFRQDPLLEGVGDPYRSRRARYIERLEELLAKDVAGLEDALAPQVHWLLAKLSADQVMSMKDELDVQKRRVHWERAREHLGILRDDYPDFHLNWRMFAPESESSLTRRFLRTVRANLDWEKKNLPSERDPQDDVVVVLRTTRGDMRFGLYRNEALDLVELLLERVTRGEYDGTAFFAKTDTKQDGEQEQGTIRGGHRPTWDAKPFERKQHVSFAEPENPGTVMPSSSRWLIPHTRGVVAAWHEPTDEYDGSQQLLVVTARSPLLDYVYTPIGKLLDEASLATADRIYAAEAWRDDLDVDLGSDDGRKVADFLQVPVTIVKALVYENGTLREPASEPRPNRAEVDESERSLETLVADAYVAKAPERPEPPAPPESSAEGDAESGEEEEDAGQAEQPEEPEQPRQPEQPEAPADRPGEDED